MVTAVPRAKLSPGRMSGYIPDRAEVNGVLIMVTVNSSPTSTGSGTPGMAMISTSTIRDRSQAIMTSRRGSRSARPDRTSPPTKPAGRWPQR